jgi:hypothetical protein
MAKRQAWEGLPKVAGATARPPPGALKLAPMGCTGSNRRVKDRPRLFAEFSAKVQKRLNRTLNWMRWAHFRRTAACSPGAAVGAQRSLGPSQQLGQALVRPQPGRADADRHRQRATAGGHLGGLDGLAQLPDRLGHGVAVRLVGTGPVGTGPVGTGLIGPG